jgi:hypothetical protein
MAQDDENQVKEAPAAYRVKSEMAKEEMRAILRDQIEGFKLVDRRAFEERKSASISERLRDVAMLFASAQAHPDRGKSPCSDRANERWKKQREAFARKP